MKTLKAVFFTIFLMTSSLGFSQVFDDFDRNQDAAIDRDEFNGMYVNSFNSWDANMDGSLDDREFYDSTFNRLDRDGDGNLDQFEWNEGYDNVYGSFIGARDMSQFDENGDIKITSEEYYNGFSESDFYASYDTNMDMRIDVDEMTETVFDSWDENGDSVLDNTEFDRYGSVYID